MNAVIFNRLDHFFFFLINLTASANFFQPQENEIISLVPVEQVFTKLMLVWHKNANGDQYTFEDRTHYRSNDFGVQFNSPFANLTILQQNPRIRRNVLVTLKNLCVLFLCTNILISFVFILFFKYVHSRVHRRNVQKPAETIAFTLAQIIFCILNFVK